MNKLKKALLTPLSIILLSGGWFLEVYYYQFRFVSDGVGPRISWILGGALTLLLSALFIESIFNSKKAKFGRIVLIILSVFCTLAGQNYSYNEKNNSNSTENAIEENKQNSYNYYTVQIEMLNKNIQDKNNLLPDNIQSRANWDTKGVQPLLKEIKGLEDKLIYYENKRDLITLKTSSNYSVVKLSAYEALAKDIGLDSPNLFKLVSLGLISLFIALMAPSGIKILESLYTPKKEVKKVKKVVTAADELTTFSDSRFFNQENPKALKSRAAVVKETGISYDQFNKYRKLEIKLNVTKKESGVIIPSVSRSEYIMLMRNKRLHTGSLQAVRG